MTVESVTYISDLDDNYPAEGEVATLHEGNDHIRNIKKALLATFPNIDSVVSATDAELNYLIGVTSDIQDQIDSLDSGKLEDSDFTGTNQDISGDAGFQKLPGGVIMQFGYTAVNRLSAGVTGPVAITFPTAFTSGVFAVLTNMSSVQPANYNSSAANITTSGFDLYASFAAAGTYNVLWVAFGV